MAEFPTSRTDALGGTVVLSTPTPSEQLISGAKLSQTEKLSVDFGYKRQYNLKELDLIYSAVSYRLKNYNFIAGFSQLGDPELYTQKTIRLGFLYSNSFFTIGNFLTGQFHNFNNRYNSISRVSYGISMQYRHKFFIISAVLDNINRPSFNESSIKANRKLTLFGEILGKGKYKTTLKLSKLSQNKKSFGIGESVKISKYSSILFGFSTAPIEFGGGVDLKLHNNSFIYNSSYHPVLGLTHSVSFLLYIFDN